jgi:hypothetical protein
LANTLAHYTDDERERLRRALAEYADALGLSTQKIADAIAVRANYALAIEGGRKRVERFLKGTHRQSDDFIAAVAEYLGSVPPPNVEQSAATLAHFLSRRVPRPIDLTPLIGRYRAWVSSDRRSRFPEDGHLRMRLSYSATIWMGTARQSG